MKYQLKLPFYLAWQYIRRGKEWTILLTIFLLAAAFINLLFVSSLFNGIIDGSNKQIINTMSGNIYITPKSGNDYITNSSQTVKKIENVDGVVAAAAQTELPARLQYNGYTGNWQILAISPNDTKQVVNIADKMIAGEYLQENDTDKIIIGRQIAGGENVANNAFSFKGAKVGDKVTLITEKGKKTFSIKGIFDTKFINSDLRAFVTNKSLENINPSSNNKTTTIIAKTDRKYSDQQMMETINNLNIDGDVYTWEEASGLMKSVSESFLSINVIVSSVGVLIAAITVFIVIYIDILNKRHQIGILRAIGIRPYIIVTSYVILSAIYAVAGVVVGTLIFYFGLIPYFQAHPFQLPITDAVLLIKYPDYIARTEAIIWVSIVSGLIPSIIIARSKMLDAIIGK